MNRTLFLIIILQLTLIAFSACQLSGLYEPLSAFSVALNWLSIGINGTSIMFGCAHLLSE